MSKTTTNSPFSPRRGRRIFIRMGPLLFGLGMLLQFPLIAQHQLALYHMQQVPQSSLLNPGQMPLMKFYIGFPGLASVRAAAGNSGFTYADIDRSNGEGETDFQSIYNGLRPRNHLAIDSEITLFGLGFRTKSGYFHLQVSESAYVSGIYPAAVFGLLDDIQRNFGREDFRATRYDLADFAVNGFAYRSYALGYTERVLPQLTVGGRVRYLQGHVGLWSDNRQLTLDYAPESDYFRVGGRLNLLAVGGSLFEEFEGVQFRTGNNGFAFDFGAVYRHGDRIEVSLSTLNLGGIRWKEDVGYAVIDESMRFSTEDTEEFLEEWGEIGDALIYDEPASEVSFRTPLPARFYLGGNYYLRTSTSVGLLINPVFFNGTTDLGLALSANTRLGKFLGLSAALTRNRYIDLGLGVGASIDLGGLQLYTVTDNLFALRDYEGAHGADVQLGINFNFGRLKRVETLIATTSPPVSETDSLAAFAEWEPDPVAPGKTRRQRPARSSAAPPVRERREAAARPQRPARTPRSARTTVAEDIAVAPPPARRPQVAWTGQTREVASWEPITGIRVEAYRIPPRGEPELAFVGSFFSGRIELELDRSASYRILVSRQGYLPREVVFSAAELAGADNQLTLDVLLERE